MWPATSFRSSWSLNVLCLLVPVDLRSGYFLELVPSIEVLLDLFNILGGEEIDHHLSCLGGVLGCFDPWRTTEPTQGFDMHTTHLSGLAHRIELSFKRVDDPLSR